jgi:hypothetical protein
MCLLSGSPATSKNDRSGGVKAMGIRLDRDQKTLYLDGVLDLAQARQAREASLSFGVGDPITIDLRRVGEIEDSALAYMAVGLKMADRRVELRGLADHQQRILVYLGLLPAPGTVELDDEGAPLR